MGGEIVKVRGAYMTIEQFLHTYKQGTIYTKTNSNVHDTWFLEAGRNIIIPDYQREYRWKEKQLSELANDINNGNCYLGQIAVSRNIVAPSNYYLVDGQQRITSIIILLTVLCRQFYLHEDTCNIKNFELHRDVTLSDESTGRRLNFEANCFPEFQKFIAQIYELSTDEEGNFTPTDFKLSFSDDYRQKNRYISACSSLNKIVSKNLNRFHRIPDQLRCVKDFIHKILNSQVSVVIFDGENTYESEKVFLDINEKGLRLDNEDILKAYYFQAISSEKGKEALETWTALKKSYFEISETLGSEKISLESYVNYAFQIDLLMQNSDFNYSKFDDDLRYKGSEGKIHICQLFSDTQLHSALKDIAMFLNEINLLLSCDANSSYYKRYLPDNDSTTREIFKLLLNSICKCEMKIVFIALIKVWWLKAKLHQHITINDIYELFSFYIISNVSGVKKERLLFTNDFISSQSEKDMYTNFHIIEIQMLNDAYSKATTLKRDLEKAEYLSFNIQMFYNDFFYNQNTNYWEIKLSNQQFLSKYSANREKYVKDHFLIQNGKTIKLYNGQLFTITQSMTLLRKRAYNFIYHEDNFENVDFVTRLEKIFQDRDKETRTNSKYGQYENDYFQFIEDQLRLFFKDDQDTLPTWETVLDKYKSKLPDVFAKIISFILEEHSVTWNHRVCKHFQEQFPKELLGDSN